jgi:predicted 3-demethylubiquinone-9 3-methyltransferase (glyoxalase superfamily)
MGPVAITEIKIGPPPKNVGNWQADEFFPPKRFKQKERTTPERTGDMKPITPCLWFDTQGEEAAKFYTSVFPNSKIVKTTYYGEAGPRAAGTVLTVEFEINGQPFVALNGGPDFKFNEALSFQVFCVDQDEVDSYWETLSDGGEEGPCGWLKDKYGVSWQIIPTAMPSLLTDPNEEKAQRVMAAMLKMGKLEIAELERAAAEPVSV